MTPHCRAQPPAPPGLRRVPVGQRLRVGSFPLQAVVRIKPSICVEKFLGHGVQCLQRELGPAVSKLFQRVDFAVHVARKQAQVKLTTTDFGRSSLR